MTAVLAEMTEASTMLGWRVELEITGRCQLQCVHCYVDSGPSGDHGTMTPADWHAIISETSTLGVTRLQFIGGEPTMHPAFPQLLGHAVGTGLRVEVFSNLVHIRDGWWPLLKLPNVSLATSYYSERDDEHAAVTGSANSHHQTRANIGRAVSWGIPIRVGVIDTGDGRRVARARADLIRLGVPADRIKVDSVREVGRASRLRPDVSQLCGHCGRGKLAVGPTGEVWPCVLSRWMKIGNVHTASLAEIVGSPEWRAAVATIPVARRGGDCVPDTGDSNDCSPAAARLDACNPDDGTCNPSSDGNDCSPAETDADY
ncbi:radical SAM/SPASM domain-containing protein [Streptosporangium sp. NPDC051022]|uniref:radical SAM/SPASM domain-containing protein n=1 Tax=Streptosporangium sp. NPDC051022 TaxID=3155752 RepID=UPI0034236557